MSELSKEQKFANDVKSWHGILGKSTDERQRDNAANKFYTVVRSILTSGSVPPGLEHPVRHYHFIDEAIGVVGDYFGDDSQRQAELRELFEAAQPVELDQYGGFAVVKHVHGALSDRRLAEWKSGGIEGKLIVPSRDDFPLAEQFRADNFGDSAALYLCDNAQNEFGKLRAHYRDVALIRAPTE
ncbi:hypothetical protein ISS07_01780 [Candidatus Woesearchaeota archaeon]|nr:hypothetical protein [Candidatus Woesearchaeota archaeon]